MTSLSCKHEFCKECVKEHLSSAVTNGKAISIRCMEQGCPERYDLESVRPHLTEEQLRVFETIN